MFDLDTLPNDLLSAINGGRAVMQFLNDALVTGESYDQLVQDVAARVIEELGERPPANVDAEDAPDEPSTVDDAEPVLRSGVIRSRGALRRFVSVSVDRRDRREDKQSVDVKIGSEAAQRFTALAPTAQAGQAIGATFSTDGSRLLIRPTLAKAQGKLFGSTRRLQANGDAGTLASSAPQSLADELPYLVSGRYEPSWDGDAIVLDTLDPCPSTRRRSDV